MQQFVNIAKALSDETRVRILLCLRRKPMCVCQIVELCGLAPSTTSKHMSILKQAGLVESRKDGRWVYYSLPGDDAPPLVNETIAWVRQSLGRDKTIMQDTKALRVILNEDPEQIARRQAARCC
jgi:DNA-binding transcriptional ArsR family regulator